MEKKTNNLKEVSPGPGTESNETGDLVDLSEENEQMTEYPNLSNDRNAEGMSEDEKATENAMLGRELGVNVGESVNEEMTEHPSNERQVDLEGISKVTERSAKPKGHEEAAENLMLGRESSINVGESVNEEMTVLHNQVAANNTPVSVGFPDKSLLKKNDDIKLTNTQVVNPRCATSANDRDFSSERDKLSKKDQEVQTIPKEQGLDGGHKLACFSEKRYAKGKGLLINLIHVFFMKSKICAKVIEFFQKMGEHSDIFKRNLYEVRNGQRVELKVCPAQPFISVHDAETVQLYDFLPEILRDRETNLLHESRRLATFGVVDERHIQQQGLNIICLACNGFYVDENGRIECFSCHHILEAEHPASNRSHYPACRFVCGISGNIPLSDYPLIIPRYLTAADVVETNVVSLQYEYLMQRMVSVDDRRCTFNDRGLTHLDPDELCVAGFFYIGPDDMVQCFVCLVRVRVSGWVITDDLYMRHARLNPYCPHIKMTKGEEFIRSTLTNQYGSLISQCSEGGPSRRTPARRPSYYAHPQHHDMADVDSRIASFSACCSSWDILGPPESQQDGRSWLLLCW